MYSTQFEDVDGAHVQLFYSLGILSFIHTGCFISVVSGIDAAVALCFPNTCNDIGFSACRQRHVSLFVADLSLSGFIWIVMFRSASVA